MSSHRERSRESFTCSHQPSIEELKLGCLQRIADSLEKIAKSNPWSELTYYKASS